MEDAMPNASQVAKYFLCFTDDESGDAISNLKLQKLLYYAQGFHLAVHDQVLFQEPIVAWRHGPAVRSVYAEYADYKSAAIPPPGEFNVSALNCDRGLLDEVYRIYGQYSAWRLREMTHAEPPWRDAWRDDGIEHVITPKALKDYFSTLVEDE
jgi:uncharacterized phage-associated protein